MFRGRVVEDTNTDQMYLYFYPNLPEKLCRKYKYCTFSKMMLFSFLKCVNAICFHPGNLLSSTILMSPNLDMKTSFRHILLMLTLFDTSFCLLAATTFSMPLVSKCYYPTTKNTILWFQILLLTFIGPLQLTIFITPQVQASLVKKDLGQFNNWELSYGRLKLGCASFRSSMQHLTFTHNFSGPR